jgi:hypothetical protein
LKVYVIFHKTYQYKTLKICLPHLPSNLKSEEFST